MMIVFNACKLKNVPHPKVSLISVLETQRFTPSGLSLATNESQQKITQIRKLYPIFSSVPNSVSLSSLAMEALGFPSLNTHSISCSSSQKRRATKPPCQRTHFSSISPPSSLKLTPSYRSYNFVCKFSTFSCSNYCVYGNFHVLSIFSNVGCSCS